MQLGRYILLNFNGRQMAFARVVAAHPLMQHTNATTLSVTICQILSGEVKKPSLRLIAAIDDITGGAVTWMDWLELIEPEYVNARKRQAAAPQVTIVKRTPEPA